MDAPQDLRGESRAHLMLGNSIADVVHVNILYWKTANYIELYLIILYYISIHYFILNYICIHCFIRNYINMPCQTRDRFAVKLVTASLVTR